MKTRENELHEPRVIYNSAHEGYNSHGAKYCSVCGYDLNWKFGCTEQEARELYIDNYCPNCGARLKEIFGVEPHDIIELPCKIYIYNPLINDEMWQIIYRTEFGYIMAPKFFDESEADAFLADLAKLKGGNNENKRT